MAGPLPGSGRRKDENEGMERDGSRLLPPPSSAPPVGREEQGEPKRAVEAAETDVWWGAYAGRAMLPGFLLCLLLTVLLLGLDLFLKSTLLWHRLQTTPQDLFSLGLLAVTGAIWLFQGTRWVYRMIAVNYRLTNRRLLYTRGFKLPESWAIELERIADVRVEARLLERLLGVGRIKIRVQNENGFLFVLDGVSAPERVARTIRRRVRQAQAVSHPTPAHPASVC